jgi:hypothetical protein
MKTKTFKLKSKQSNFYEGTKLAPSYLVTQPELLFTIPGPEVIFALLQSFVKPFSLPCLLSCLPFSRSNKMNQLAY